MRNIGQRLAVSPVVIIGVCPKKPDKLFAEALANLCFALREFWHLSCARSSQCVPHNVTYRRKTNVVHLNYTANRTIYCGQLVCQLHGCCDRCRRGGKKKFRCLWSACHIGLRFGANYIIFVHAILSKASVHSTLKQVYLSPPLLGVTIIFRLDSLWKRFRLA